MTIEERTYEVLCRTKAITDKLAGGADGIYKGRSPDAGSYPVLVYAAISQVPHLWADNRLKAERTTIRITIVTANGTYQALADSVFHAMAAAGFTWQSSAEEQDGQLRYKVMQFTYAEEVG